MNGTERQQAAVDDALMRLEAEALAQRRRARTAVERIHEGVVKILGGNQPPSYSAPAPEDP